MRTALLLSVISMLVASAANATELPVCPGTGNQIDVPAKHYLKGKSEGVEVGVLNEHDYGADTMHNAAPYTDRPNHAVWQFVVKTAGPYLLQATYAAQDSRPVQISVNGAVVAPHGLVDTTGSWNADKRGTFVQVAVNLRHGLNELDYSSAHVFPHIYLATFTRLCPMRPLQVMAARHAAQHHKKAAR